MAQHVDVIMKNLRGFIDTKLVSMSQANPLLAFAKPLVSRAVDNNLYKVETVLKQVSDKDGMVDVEGILGEMIENVTNTKPIKMNTGFLGELEIGAGKIKIDVPLMNKSLVFNQMDLMELKEMLTH